MPSFTVHTGTGVPLRRSNVDTDQIVPARFGPGFSKTGFGNALFADWRDDPSFVLNSHEYQGATVLVAGNDFGTGSSREFAVWAITKAGFLAVLAPRFGDIFSGNALMNGLLPVVLPAEVICRLWELIEADPGVEITIDLAELEVRCADVAQAFALDEDARQRLLSGQDAIGVTMSHEDDIAAYEARRRRTLPTTT